MNKESYEKGFRKAQELSVLALRASVLPDEEKTERQEGFLLGLAAVAKAIPLIEIPEEIL